jgi:hypothetical protein
MTEFQPVGLGLLLGLAVGTARPSIGRAQCAALAIALGVLASVVTGEVEVSWSYVLVDIPLVALAAVVGQLATRRVHHVEERT